MTRAGWVGAVGGIVGLGIVVATDGLPLAEVRAQTLRQERMATVRLDDGHTVRGEFQDIQNDTVYLRLSADEERRLEVSRVVVIAFQGSAEDPPQSEIERTHTTAHFAVLRGDDTIAGRLLDVEREGEGDRTVDSPVTFVFRTSGGAERRVPVERLARLYFGAYPDAPSPAGTRQSDLSSDESADGVVVVVSANRPWTATGVSVARGASIRFSATGEIRLSDDRSDTADPSGSTRGRFLEAGPLAGARAGVLLGKVGDAVFQIGAESGALSMPSAGLLELGVNDDHHADNFGTFRVEFERQP